MNIALRFAWWRMLQTLTYGGIAVGVIAILGVLAPPLEARLFPVLTHQATTEVSRIGDKVTFEIEVQKDRDCRIASASWSARAGTRYTPLLVYNPAGEPAVGVTTYEPGEKIQIGPFTTILPAGFADADDILGLLYYDCHPGWLTRQRLGPIFVPH